MARIGAHCGGMLALQCGLFLSCAHCERLLGQEPLLGALVGSVRDSSSVGLPLVRVVVGVDTLRSTLTNEVGGFRIENVPAGVHEVHFRRLGYVPASFTLLILADQDTRVQVVLSTIALPLKPVEVSADQDRSLELAGFYERRRQREAGAMNGTFIDPRDIASRPAAQVTRLLEAIPGLTIDRQSRRGRAVAIPRGRAFTQTGQRCQLAVFLDGWELDPRDVANGLDFLLSPSDVAAMEVYLSASGMPDRFRSMRLLQPCGSVVIWTKV